MNITFNKGILGLENLKKFDLVDLKDLQPYKLLQSCEDKDIGLVVVSPFEIIDCYEIKLSDEVIENLKIESEKDIMLYTTVNINSDVNKITSNLRAPIAINIKSKLGEQIVLQNEAYEIKHPISKG